MTPELKRLLNDLVEEHGQYGVSDRHGTGYKAIHKTKRKNAIRHLVKTLKDSGKEREYCESATFQGYVSKFLFPDHVGSIKSKINGGRNAICKEIDEVVAELWKDTSALSKEVPIAPQIEKPKIEEPKFAGRDINKELYKKDLEFVPQLNEFASMIGVTDDE